MFKLYFILEVVFDVCLNDCILFRREYKDVVICFKCNNLRFKEGKIFKRIFYYLFFGLRLVWNFGIKDILCIF